MEIGGHWDTISKVVQEAFNSCLHCAIATINDDGAPHVTPIGSLILRDDGTGFYFEEFLSTTLKNLERNKRVCVLAVNSDKKFWFESLLGGEFTSPPAVRIMGVVGEKREATEQEIALWQKKVQAASQLKGYEILWKNMRTVRDIYFDSFEPVHTGSMTGNLWED